MNDTKPTLGIFYGTGSDTEMLAQKFVGNLINDENFCKACELLDQRVKCDHCRESVKHYAESIVFYEQLGANVPSFIEEPEQYLPQNIPRVDFILVIGIHQDLLSGLPDYLKGKDVKAVIIPVEDPRWVPPGLQVQLLKSFEDKGIQVAFPKPFCALSKDFNEYNEPGFNVTIKNNFIGVFIDYFKIGEPHISFLLSKDGKSIESGCVMRSAPCGSTYFIVQQLKGKYVHDNHISLNEKISKAHHSYPCNASMNQDNFLKDSVLHIAGYLVRDEIRRNLNLKIEKTSKLLYVIK
jgi:hypothetical protein